MSSHQGVRREKGVKGDRVRHGQGGQTTRVSEEAVHCRRGVRVTRARGCAGCQGVSVSERLEGGVSQ